jgi:hypothetical protein
VLTHITESAITQAAENLWMQPDDQHLLVIKTIESAFLPAFGKPARRELEKSAVN